MATLLSNARLEFLRKVLSAQAKMVRGRAFNDRVIFDEGAEDLKDAVNAYFNQEV